MKVLLDTNVCIAVMRGHPGVLARLTSHPPGECVLSTVAVYELLTGVEKCREPERERAKVRRLLSLLQVKAFDEAAASCAAQARAKLERTGNPCGPYDLLLAGHALVLDLPLATTTSANFAAWTDSAWKTG